MSIEEIKVSVCVVTYNQEKYIAQCLQSLVDQKTDFNFEVIISDDCSTDKTPEIIKEFHNKYPDIIKPILHEENMGAFKNFIFVHEQAVGEYIAHIDGDDYALPKKLQKQADYLDANPDCNIVWAHILIEDQNGDLYKQNKIFREFVTGKIFYRPDLIKFGTVGANSTKMYRSGIYKPEDIKFPIIDYYINVKHVGDGYACFVGNEPLGVYRLGVGISSSGTKTRKIWIDNIWHLYKKYKIYRAEFNSVLLMILLSDLLGKKNTFLNSFWKYIVTFHPLSVIFFIRNYKVLKSINLRKE